STLKGHDVDYEIFTPDVLNLKAVTLKKDVADTYGKPQEPRTYVEFEKDFEERLDGGFFNDYDAIGFDSMTTFSDIVMDRIMYLNNRFGKWPEQADWTATMNTIKNVMRTWTSIEDCVSYVTVHNEFKQEDASGKMMNVLVLIGRLRNSLPLLFSEIWRFYADTDKDGNPRYYIQTTQDRYNPYIRNTMRGLSPVEDVTIENWMKPEDYGISALIQKSTS
ncbi:hypothetical protein LCGC14_2132580, partial [marine sediment metagenome]